MFRRNQNGQPPAEVNLGACEQHSFDHAAGTCGRCSANFCAACLVFPFGPKKAPYCIPCALAVAGVRR